MEDEVPWWQQEPYTCAKPTRESLDRDNIQWHKDRARRKPTPSVSADHGYKKPFPRNNGRKIGFRKP